MTSIQAIPADLLSALALFVKELDAHLVFFKSLLAELEKTASADRLEHLQERAKAMEHRFHVIKGAASFFKLQEIRASAVDGESLFKDGQLECSDEEEALSTLKRIFDTLNTESMELRTVFAEMHQ